MGKYFSKASHLRAEGIRGYDPTNPKTIIDPNSEFLSKEHKHGLTGKAIDRLSKEWLNREPPAGVRKEGNTGVWKKVASRLKTKYF